MSKVIEKVVLKILVVEHSLDDLYLIRELLTVDPYNTYDFTGAYDGNTALVVASKQHYDCVLVYNRLDDMSELEFFTKLKTVSLNKTIPIIILGEENDSVDANKILESGFHDYLVKGSSLTSWVLSRTITKAIDNVKLQALVAQLSEALTARDDFLSIAAHELKTPLTVAKMKFQMGLRQIESKPLENLKLDVLIDCYKDGDRQISRLHRVVDNLLDLTRLESDKLVLHLTEVNLPELINEVIDRFMPQFKFSRCVPVIEMPEVLTGVWDADRLDQVLTNIMTNIIRYASGVAFSLKVKQVNDRVLITVEDGGPGIPVEHQERVFSRYERSERENKHQGIGLGLYITRGIIENHQGTIVIDPTYHNGTKMVIDLPLVSKT